MVDKLSDGRFAVDGPRGTFFGVPRSGIKFISNFLAGKFWRYFLETVVVCALTLGTTSGEAAEKRSTSAPRLEISTSRPEDPCQKELITFLKSPNYSSAHLKLVDSLRHKMAPSPRVSRETMRLWANNPHGEKEELSRRFRSIVGKILMDAGIKGEEKSVNSGQKIVHRKKLTDYEELMDAAGRIVASGDLSLRCFPAKAFAGLEKHSNGGKPHVTVVNGLPAESLQHFPSSNGKPPIVQVASRFNGLESARAETVDSLPEWTKDNAQGPGIALTALAGAAERYVAYLQGTLPDAIEPLLRECRIGGVSILDLYPCPEPEAYQWDLEQARAQGLHKNGHFRPWVIGNIQHLRILREHIATGAGDLGILCQWVRCEESGTDQLQVFSSAASFAQQEVDWRVRSPKIAAHKNLCEILLVTQYRALGQLAAATGMDLHLTAVGIGAFKNPSEILGKAL
ncbi:MAG: hypothetical protein LBS68_02215, partial [Puniceicoccales bacterium]|nr:hypothetical protein [Puniceicoccales bacterium]